MPVFLKVQGHPDVDLVDFGTNGGAQPLLVEPLEVTRLASNQLTPQLLQACKQRMVIPHIVLETVGPAGESRITVTNACFVSVPPSEHSQESLVIDEE